MVIYFDGGCAPTNPGPMRCALVVDGKPINGLDLGYGTNNLAEWTALIWALEFAASENVEEVEIIGDSKLVVMQSTGKWKIKHAPFLPFKREADRLMKQFKKCVIRYVDRNHNAAGIHMEFSGLF